MEDSATCTNRSATTRRRLTDCPYAYMYTCSDCTDVATDDNAWFDSDCYWNTASQSCSRDSSSNTVASSSDCPANCGSAGWAASQLRHELNQKAISWALRKAETGGCTYISGGCAPCCNALVKVLMPKLNAYLTDRGDQFISSFEDEAASWVSSRIFSSTSAGR